MDFSPWTTRKDVSQKYHLYAVLVHEGSQASSGHYYVFVKTGGKWFKFNDERVEAVSRQKALDYNYGGLTQMAEYDAKQMKVNSRAVTIKSTAYMLVYVDDEVAS